VHQLDKNKIRDDNLTFGPFAGGIRLSKMHVTHVLGYKF